MHFLPFNFHKLVTLVLKAQTFKITLLASNFSPFCKSDVLLNFVQINAYVDIKFNYLDVTFVFYYWLNCAFDLQLTQAGKTYAINMERFSSINMNNKEAYS